MAWELGALVVMAVSGLARVAPPLIHEAGQAAKPLLRLLAKDKGAWYVLNDPATKRMAQDIDEGIKKAADGIKEATKTTYDYVNYKDEAGGWTKK